jgi:uncharacterized protein (TIGR03067 family)
MKTAFAAIAISLSLSSLSLSTIGAAEDAKSPLIGKWVMTTAFHKGEEMTKAPLIRFDLAFDADKATLTYEKSEQGGNEKTVTGKYTYDASKKPARILLKDFPSEIPTTVLVKVEGDKLVICYDSKGGAVPSDFKTTKDDHLEIVHFAKRTQ